MVTVLKNSPIILMRPLIGSTEAVSKLLMGVGNQIDGKKLVEKKINILPSLVVVCCPRHIYYYLVNLHVEFIFVYIGVYFV